VAGLGELNAVFHGLAVADFADQDHIGPGAGCSSAPDAAVAIDADFAVVTSSLVRVHVFHRISMVTMWPGFFRSDSPPWGERSGFAGAVPPPE